MVVKVYISGISGNKEVKKRQQRVLMILDSKNIKYEVIDIAEPGREADKDFMQINSKSAGATMSDPEPRHPLPPQIFNDNEYCGDYDQFDLANEMDTLEQLLKVEAPAPEPRVDKVEENNVNGTVHSEEIPEKVGEENEIASSKENSKEREAEKNSLAKELNDEIKEAKLDISENYETLDKINTNLKETTTAKEENSKREGNPLKEGALIEDGSPPKEGSLIEDGSPLKEGTLIEDGTPAIEKTLMKEGTLMKQVDPEKNEITTRHGTPEKEGTPVTETSAQVTIEKNEESSEKEASRVEQDVMSPELVKKETPENESIPEKQETPEKEVSSESENTSSREPSIEKRVTHLEGTQQTPEGQINADLSDVLIGSKIAGASQ